MRVPTSFAAGLAGFAVVLALVPLPATPANPGSFTAARNARAAHDRGRLLLQPRVLRTPEGCATNNPSTSFVALQGEGDVAGGQASSVLGGLDNQACDFASAIGAGESNGIGFEGSAFYNFIGAGEHNAAMAEYGFIGAGTYNLSIGYYSFVGSGLFNAAEGPGAVVSGGDYVYYVRNGLGGSTPSAYGNIASGADSFVGAGDLNQVSGNGSFIGAGGYTYGNGGATTAGNQIAGTDSFIGAGDQNNVGTSDAFIGAGQGNVVKASGANTAVDAFIGGGYLNTVNGAYAAIGGGDGNLAGGFMASIPGGYHNDAGGAYSFAAGYTAVALTNGSFVWSDYSPGSPHVSATSANEFLARASGGVEFFSNAGLTTGVKLAAGGGSWASLSDRTLKTGVVPLDDAAVLAKVAALPVSEWSYTSEHGVRHVGPMAQDFYAAFRVGEDDRHITTIDEDGIALSAIKALHSENASLRARLAALERKVDALGAARGH